MVNKSQLPKVWSDMGLKIREVLGGNIGVIPAQPDLLLYRDWFKSIEAESFRLELRYSDDEIEERLVRPNLLFIFITHNGAPEGVILGYMNEQTPSEFYLDTIAVKTTGRGIGRIMMDTLMKWAREKGFTRIVLDTEFVSERSIHLKEFYQRLGFVETDTTDDGNITMLLEL